MRRWTNGSVLPRGARHGCGRNGCWTAAGIPCSVPRMNIPDGPLRDQLEFAETDALLRDDVRRLGALVGEVLAEQGSPALLAEVEAIRRAAIARREQGLPVDALAGEMARVPVDDAELVVRAFSTYFGAINLAERVH